MLTQRLKLCVKVRGDQGGDPCEAISVLWDIWMAPNLFTTFCQLAFLSCELNCLDTHCLSLVCLMRVICVTIVDILQMSQSLFGF